MRDQAYYDDIEYDRQCTAAEWREERIESKAADMQKDIVIMTEAISETLDLTDCDLMFRDPTAFGERMQAKCLAYLRRAAEYEEA